MSNSLDGFLSEKIPEPEVLPEEEESAIIFKAGREGSLDLIKTLTAKGLWIKVITPCKETLLHLACKSGNLSLIQYLCERELDVNGLSLYGTPLLEAVNLPFRTVKQRQNKGKILDYLFSQGVDVNLMEEEFKETPLLRACLLGDFSTAHFLLDHGADLFIKGRNDTPLTKAVGGFCACFEKEFFKIIDLLLEKGATLEEMDRNGLKPIHKACFRAETGLIKFLVEKGADLDVQITSGQYGYGDEDLALYVGMTPLMLGVLSKELAVVKLLLGLGSDTDLGTSDEVFALDLAEDLNDEDLINALEGGIQLFDIEEEEVGWVKSEDDEEEKEEKEEEEEEEEEEEKLLQESIPEEKVEDDFKVHDPVSEMTQKNFNMFDEMAEEDILDEKERVEKEEAKKKEEEDIMIGDGSFDETGDLMEDKEEVVDDKSDLEGDQTKMSKESIDLKADEFGEKSFQMFDEMAEEDLEEEVEEKEEDDEDPFSPKSS